MKMNTKNLIIWVIILPLCLLIAALSTFPLRLLLWSTLNKFVKPYPVYIEKLLSPLVVGSVFVYSSYLIAPCKKYITSVFFGSIWTIFILYIIIVTHYELSIFSYKFSSNDLDIMVSIFGLFGGMIGVYFTHKKEYNRE